MGLLADIQSSVIDEAADIGPILLKVRLLAARLGSVQLEEWVRHESEGYPLDAPLPQYRYVGVSYTGNFSGAFQSGIRNAPIPPALIAQLAGEHWVRHPVRQSMAAVDDLIKTSKKGGGLELSASNLILALTGKVYPDYQCNSVTGSIPRSSIVEIQHAVRSRILELTLQLEKSVPHAGDIELSGNKLPQVNAATVNQITNQTIYGGTVTNMANSGAQPTFNIGVATGDAPSFVESLVGAGIARNDASELAEIVASETPESANEPFGKRTKNWLLDNLRKAADGTWGIGLSVATDTIKAAVVKYYGLG